MQAVILIASGDLRLAANQKCWPAQEKVEQLVSSAIENFGFQHRRGHAYDPAKKHGFIDSQKYGMQVFRDLAPDAPLIVVEAVWQYSHHVLPGLMTHRGPILTIANWSGEWPGLVGMLNLNGSLTKAGVSYSTLWSTDFSDDYFLSRLHAWLRGEAITHDHSHVHPLSAVSLPRAAAAVGAAEAQRLKREKAIMGVFDEGCMGMFNAIVPDHLLNPLGIFKERLSQSSLYAGMKEVSKAEAQGVRNWLDASGMKFVTGPNPETDLTDDQILDQCRMYIAALRIADDFGCDSIGIQYQQGLKDMVPASDLVEGLLNNADRPPVRDASGKELYAGGPLPHFNEVDEGAGVDALVTNHCWKALQLDPSTTLHDVRWGEHYSGDGLDEFVWVLQISGAAPASHFVDGYRGASSDRQPPMYFPLGGGTLKGVGRPGKVVWSRVFVEGGSLHVDIGLGSVVALPAEETERRWKQTTTQWPMVSATFDGISRDAFMARHRANHVSIAYAPDEKRATQALAVKAAMFDAVGVRVHLCGTIDFE